MLVLSRKLGQSIIVRHDGEELEIVLLHVGPGEVRMGLEAPQSFRIRRAELPPQPPETPAA